jgi:hypothetical protein
MADPLDALAADLAERVKAHLRDAVDGPLVVSIPAAAKLLRKRESLVRAAVESGELPSWDGGVLVEDAVTWWKRHRDAETRKRRPKLVA